jgi:RHS repeat-associated protein
MGRVLRSWQCTPRTCPTYSFTYLNYAYDLAGNLTSLIDAAGTRISYGHDAASRVTTVTSSLNDAQHPATLYSVDASVGYYPNGALRKATFGNGLTETSAFNKRLQPCRMNVNSGGGYFSQCTDAVPSSSVLDFTMGYNAGSSDNDNVASWSAVGNQTFSRSYAYDALNRIQSMSDSATGQACKGMSWTVDAWGNMTNQMGTAGTCFNFSAAVGTNNQLQVGYQYDAAGNMTYDGSHHYSYDAENRIVQVDSGSTASYIYNEIGSRVQKNIGGGFTEYYYGPNGSVQDEYNGSAWTAQYVYVGSELIAEYKNNTTEFVHTDHLGSTRLVTAVNKSVLDSLDYPPFGKQVAGATASTHKFTGKERDAESGLDNFGARYYGSAMGRFASPDPKRNSAHSIEPQSWNRYSYVSNNPLKFVDPDGAEKRLVVYIQQPVLGKPTVWVRQGFTANVGHSFIGLKDTDAKTETKRGFYPSKPTDPTSPTVPGVVKDNADHSWSVKKEFVISDQQYDKLNQSVANDTKNPPEYDLNTNNCTDWVNHKAGEVGVTLPDPQGTWPGGQGSNPGMEGQALRDQGGQVNDQNGSGSSSSSNGGSSNNNSPANAQQANELPQRSGGEIGRLAPN